MKRSEFLAFLVTLLLFPKKIFSNSQASLLKAIETDDLEMAKEAIAQGAKLDYKMHNGKTPLHLAAEKEAMSILSFLLKKKIEPDPVDKKKWTPLLRACKIGNFNIVEKLFKFKASISHKSKYGLTSLFVASFQGHSDIVNFLLEQKADQVPAKNGMTPLMAASLKGNLEVAELLLKANKKVNEKDKKGYTALLYAGKEGNKELAELLIKNGADVNVKTKKGQSLGDFIEKTGSTEMKGLLKGKGK